jgi:hypothetical protein
MPHIYEDRIAETSTTTGTGNLTLAGALTGYKAFSAVSANNDTLPYLILAVDGSGNPSGDWETGVGTWQTGGILVRTTVINSSNADALVSFAAGTKRVYLSAIANALAKFTVDGALILPVLANDPATPSTDMVLYGLDVAGRKLPKWLGSSGLDTPVQSGMFFNNVSLITAGGGTTPSLLGCTITSVGTVSHPNIGATNLKTQTRRFVNTSAAAAGSLASTRAVVLECWRGNSAGFGGFFVLLRFGLSTLQAGNRGFFGIHTSSAAPTNVDPLTDTALGKLGLGFNTNSGNLFLINNAVSSAPTTLDLGANYPINTTNLYELVLFAPPNAADIKYRVRNLSGGFQTDGTLTSNIPAATASMARVAWMTNNATAAAVAWDLSRFGLETDY